MASLHSCKQSVNQSVSHTCGFDKLVTASQPNTHTMPSMRASCHMSRLAAWSVGHRAQAAVARVTRGRGIRHTNAVQHCGGFARALHAFRAARTASALCDLLTTLWRLPHPVGNSCCATSPEPAAGFIPPPPRRLRGSLSNKRQPRHAAASPQ